jgi:hypothetical protein
MGRNDITKLLPRLLSGEKLINELECIPSYDESIREREAASRLMCLSDLYKVYIPSAMSVEIYNKLYLATAMSLQKKQIKLAVRQQNITYKAMHGNEYRGIIGGSDSFTIIGTSGIGKSSAIDRAISLISGNSIIEVDNPYTKIIPCIVVQCPFDCSPKGLLLEILRVVDLQLGTTYYQKSQRAGVTTDLLIGTISQVVTNHVGTLIIDEIQHLAGHKNGKTLVNMLVQLLNNSGISIGMVGTPEIIPFLEQVMQMARRSLGLQYGVLAYDDYFKDFCRLLFGYQYVMQKTEISEMLLEWLYEHSAGILSVVIGLLHDAQEMAIFSGKEILNLETLSEAYESRMTLMHNYISPSISQNKNLSKSKAKKLELIETIEEEEFVYQTISELVQDAKNQSIDVVEFLKDKITVVAVAV